MNLLGHNYIAYKILGRVSPNTLVGSHIPDFVPFLPNSVFSFEEIHEGHEAFLHFIKKSYPKMIDLPLSMMCHSVKYGADEYNRTIDTWLLNDNGKLKETLSKRISEASNIPYETAIGPRLHNYLWCGIDLFLIKSNLDGITTKLTGALDTINYSKISEVLGKFYGKNKELVENNIREHFKYIKAETFQYTKDFTVFWGQFLSQLSDGDNLDIDEGIELLEFIYKEFESEWPVIIDLMENNVRKKMLPFLK